MVIRQGDIFWLNLPAPKGSECGYRHPHVVVQNNIFNGSNINTAVVCAVTSNMARAFSPGNVTLKKGEANLPKRSVINITQLITVNKFDLTEKIGSLSKKRVYEMISGLKLLLEPRDIL
jgi:mRNA interferase MazF